MEDFSRLSRAPPSSAERDRLKRPCHGGVDGFEILWMGSEVTFVQFTSASRCVGELGLCGIALNGVRETGQRTRRRRDAYKLKLAPVTLSQIGVWSRANHGFSFARYTSQKHAQDRLDSRRWNRKRGHSGKCNRFECAICKRPPLSLQAARRALEALGSDLPKLEFHDLLAGFDLFSRTGSALPRETVE